LETLLGFCHCNTLSLIVTAMVSDNLTWDTEPGDNLIEYEEGCCLPIRFNCSHGLGPLIKVVDDHDNVLMPPRLSWVAINEVHPSLSEGTIDNNWVNRGWMQVHFPSDRGDTS
jgi:hypothetical protein